MRTFISQLEQNGIVLPASKLMQKLFLRKWRSAQERFNAIADVYDKTIHRASISWENEVAELISDWAPTDSVSAWTAEHIKTFDAFSFEAPHFKFSDPKSAIEAFKSFDILELERKLYRELWAESRRIKEDLRKAWVEDLVSAAPENCSLIVIKGSHSLYYRENEERFDNACERGIPSIVSEMCSPIWISFKPADAIPNTKYWLMSKNSSSVKYLVKTH